MLSDNCKDKVKKVEKSSEHHETCGEKCVCAIHVWVQRTTYLLMLQGYIVSVPTKNDRNNEVVVCTSCARAMRGRFKLTKLPESFDFSCAMGTSKYTNWWITWCAF